MKKGYSLDNPVLKSHLCRIIPSFQAVFLSELKRIKLAFLSRFSLRATAELPVVIHQDLVSPPVSITSRQWMLFETTRIEGWVKRVRRGTILKTISGNTYQVVERVVLLELELSPEVTIITDGGHYKLIVEGLKNNLLCRLHDKAEELDSSSDFSIDARIAEVHNDSLGTGERNMFSGFNNGHIHELDKGQMWEQTEPYICDNMTVMPRAMIWNNGTVYQMRVDGIEKAITVQRCSAVALPPADNLQKAIPQNAATPADTGTNRESRQSRQLAITAERTVAQDRISARPFRSL